MADNFSADESTDLSATDVAADEISGVKHQRVKVQYGADGSASDASDSLPFPVKDVPQAIATAALTNASSTAYEASRVVKASAGRLYRFTVYSSLGSAQWIQFHNTTTLPANGVAPVLIYKIATIAHIDIDLGVYGRYFSTGITVCNSTTGPTKTIGAADCWFDIQYL